MKQFTGIGFVGADAQVKEVKDKKVINFNIGISDNKKNSEGEKSSTTTWVECSIWREKDKDKISTYIKKGKHVFIQGDIEVSAYLPKDSSEPRGVLHVNVDEIEFLDKAAE